MPWRSVGGDWRAVGGTWNGLGAAVPSGGVSATGGVELDVGEFRRHDYVTSGDHTFTVVTGGQVFFEVVAPGGPGGSGQAGGFGGGGAGDVISGSVTLTPGTYTLRLGSIGQNPNDAPVIFATDTIIFLGTSHEQTAVSGGPGGSRDPDQVAVRGGGGNQSATTMDGTVRGSMAGAAHPTSFRGGDAGPDFGIGGNFARRTGGGGRGNAGDGTNGIDSVPGVGGPGVASVAPGLSATYGRGGDGGHAATASNGQVGVQPGDGGGGAGSTSGSLKYQGGDGGPPIVHLWYLRAA